MSIISNKWANAVLGLVGFALLCLGGYREGLNGSDPLHLAIIGIALVALALVRRSQMRRGPEK
jgi:hypothetical protein